MTRKDTRVHEGGPNVFADLGLPDARFSYERGIQTAVWISAKPDCLP
jgi:hypothetical protein